MVKSEISQIFLSGDILCTRSSEQDSNIRWMLDMLTTPIHEASNVTPVAMNGEGEIFSRAAFFDKSEIIFDAHNIHFDFDPSLISSQSIDYLAECFGENSLLVGYEISRATQDILKRANVQFVDMWLHPVRFLDDVLFGFRSSEDAINRKLQHFAYDTDKVQAEANLLKIQSYRGFNRFNQDIATNTALFVGQTVQDKAILKDGKFLNLLDYADQFQALTAVHEKVYFSRHPFVRAGDEDVLRFVRSFKNVEFSNFATYHLLTHPGIKKVATISSSVAQEAKYFGKDVEVWFRPAFEMEGNGCYYAVMQAFCFPHFWSQILAPIMQTKQVENMAFDTAKNKIRESMSFYWSYRDINKFEHYLQSKTNGSNRGVVPSPVDFDPKTKILDMHAGSDILNRFEIISFDIFDTLLQRDCISPKDIFKRVGLRLDSYPKSADNFVQERVAAERRAAKAAEKTGRSDPTLRGIYAQIKSLTDEECDRAIDYEIEEEEKALNVRPIGKFLFDEAQKAGKTIILVSDMYLPKNVVASFLQKNGFSGYDQLFVSVESGCSKRNGALFRHLIQKRTYILGQTLHIGDNPNGDVIQAAKLGLEVAYIPRPTANFQESCSFMETAFKEITAGRNLDVSKILATLCHENFENFDVLRRNSVFLNSPARFGAIALTPFIVGFASWLHQQAKQQNIQHLIFLARDAKLFHDAYSILYEDQANNCKVSYLRASRRMMRSALIDKVEDAQAIADGNLINITVADWVKNNFEIEVSQDVFDRFGQQDAIGPDMVMTNRFNRKLLKAFVLHIWPLIDEQMQREKTDLKTYLVENGVDQKGCAVVDIGYAGTTQKAIFKILNRKVTGFYVLKSERSNDEHHKDTPMISYISKEVRLERSNLGLAKYRFLYEGVLCEPTPSAKFVSRLEDNFVIEKQKNTDPVEKQEFIKMTHTACRDMISVLKDKSGVNWADIVFPSTAATAILDNYFKNPGMQDALLMKALSFEDIFAYQGQQYFITEDVSLRHTAVWQEGQRAAYHHSSLVDHKHNKGSRNGQFLAYGIFGWRELYTPIVAQFVKRIGGVRQMEIYLDNPSAFFFNLPAEKYRRIGKWLYPKGDNL